MTSEATAKNPVSAMSSRPTSLSLRNGRCGAFSKTRPMPFDRAEKMPSAPHARKPMLMIVIAPRDSMTASMIAADRLGVERRARPRRSR